MSLIGKKVIVTGAGSVPGRGMGRAIARAFGTAGASVVVADLVADTARETAALLRAEGVEAIDVAADVSVRADVERMVATADDAFGRIDVLVNHAGLGDRGYRSLLETDDEWWARCLAVNLTGPFLCTRAVLPGMIRNGRGVILNTISVSGLIGASAGAAYTAAKHGLVGLTRNTAATYGRTGIRCIGICPGGIVSDGTVATNRTFEASEAADLYEQVAASRPEMGRPEEVAAVVAFMADDQASYVNGAIVPVDGGWHAAL